MLKNSTNHFGWKRWRMWFIHVINILWMPCCLLHLNKCEVGRDLVLHTCLFGYIVYAMVPDEWGINLKNYTKCLFFGYCEDTKTYRLIYLKINKIIKSIHFVFIEPFFDHHVRTWPLSDFNVFSSGNWRLDFTRSRQRGRLPFGSSYGCYPPRPLRQR